MTTVLDLGVLLPQLVALTRQSFDLYAVSLFLFSPDTGQLNLVASTGDAGRRLLESGRIFHIDEARGLVSQAARSRSSIVINDVQANSDHLINPYLPETCSEIAVPMLVGNRLIGVLDLQSAAVNRFGTDDVVILTTHAEQVAIAIRNALLCAEAEAARAAAEEANEVKSRFLANMSPSCARRSTRF
jgi:GAF domain-containing protein